MGSMLRKRTGFVVVFAIVIAGMFAPSALANSPLTISKTATAHWTRSFDWTIEKSVSPSSHTLQTGQSGTSKYTVTVTKNEGTSSMWVDGQICLQNTGSVATENLTIVDRLRAYRPGGSQTLISSNIDVSANPVLDPGESYCYAYSFPFGPFPDATAYENDARATITNDPREPGAALGPSATAPFTVPDAPVVTNGSVNVDDTNGMSWLFSASGSQSYNRTFTCDRDKGAHSNTATIRETGQNDSATVTVTCKDKPGDCLLTTRRARRATAMAMATATGETATTAAGTASAAETTTAMAIRPATMTTTRMIPPMTPTIPTTATARATVAAGATSGEIAAPVLTRRGPIGPLRLPSP